MYVVEKSALFLMRLVQRDGCGNVDAVGRRFQDE